MKANKTVIAKLVGETQTKLLKDCRALIDAATAKLFKAGIVSTMTLTAAVAGNNMRISITQNAGGCIDPHAEVRKQLMAINLHDLRAFAVEAKAARSSASYEKSDLVDRILERVEIDVIQDFILELDEEDEDFDEEEDEDDGELTLAEELFGFQLHSLIGFARTHGVPTEHKPFKNKKQEKEFKAKLAHAIVDAVDPHVVEAFIDGDDEDEAPRATGKAKKKAKAIKPNKAVETVSSWLVENLKAPDLSALCSALDVVVQTKRKVKGLGAPTKLEMAANISATRKPDVIREAMVALELPQPTNTNLFD